MDTPHALFLADLIDAAVIAGHTHAHQIAAPFGELVGRLGIGDQLARHTDQICLTRTDQRIAALRRNASKGHHRHLDGILQRHINPAEVLTIHRRGRYLHPVAGKGPSVRIEVVDKSCGFESGRDLQSVVRVVAKRRELVDAHAHAERRVANLALDRFHNFHGKPEPVLEISAIPVGPPIKVGGDERSQQAIMRDLDLHPVKTGFHEVTGAGRKAGYDSFDVLLVHRLGGVMARWLGHLCRRPHDVRRVFQRRVPAMGQLPEDARSVQMRSVGNAPQARHDGGVPSVDETSGHLAGGVHGLTFHDNQSHPAASPLLMIGAKVIGRHAVQRSEGRKVRLKHDPVSQTDPGNRKGAQQMCETCGAALSLWRVSIEHRSLSNNFLRKRLRKRLPSNHPMSS